VERESEFAGRRPGLSPWPGGRPVFHWGVFCVLAVDCRGFVRTGLKAHGAVAEGVWRGGWGARGVEKWVNDPLKHVEGGEQGGKQTLGRRAGRAIC
jgi:hypothetical protein